MNARRGGAGGVLFEQCLQLIEAEKSHCAEVTDPLQPPSQVLEQAVQKLLKTLDEVDFSMLCKVTPVLFKTLSKMISSVVSIQSCSVHNLKKCASCLELEVKLMSCFQVAIDIEKESNCPNAIRLKREVFNALIFQTEKQTAERRQRCMMGTMLFLNIIVLEAMKMQVNSSFEWKGLTSDFEHITYLSLRFLSVTLSLFADEIFELHKCGDERNGMLQYLRGAYLAQTVQASLVFSQTGAKKIASEAICVLQSLLSSSFGKDFSLCHKECVSIQSISSIAADWRSFYPGIFGGLHSMFAMGFKRGSHILFAGMRFMLQLTTVVTADIFTDCIPVSCTEAHCSSADISVHKMLTVVQGQQVYMLTNGDVKTKIPCKPSETCDHSQSKSNIENTTLPCIVLDSKWRADFLQRITHSLSQSYRIISSGGSDEMSSHRCNLMDSLVALIYHSERFLGQSAIVEFILLICENIPIRLEYPSKVERKAIFITRSLPRMLNPTMWRDVQSCFITRFVNGVILLNDLVPAAQSNQNNLSGVSSGTDEEILSCLKQIVGCSFMLPSVRNSSTEGGMEAAVRILLNHTDDLKANPGGALRYLVHLFLPVVGVGEVADYSRLEQQVTVSGSSWKGKKEVSSSQYSILNTRKYKMHGQFVNGGYYKCPNIFLSTGSAGDFDEATTTEGLNEVNGLLRRLCGVIGSTKSGFDALMNMWESALDGVVHSAEKMSRTDKHKSEKSSLKEESLNLKELRMEVQATTKKRCIKDKQRVRKRQLQMYSSLQWALGATELLHFMFVGLDQAQLIDHESVDVASFVEENCAYCGQLGNYRTNGAVEDEEAKKSQSMASLLRCGRCRSVYYCCKLHQKKHWRVHRNHCFQSQESEAHQRPLSSSTAVIERRVKDVLVTCPKIVQVVIDFFGSSALATGGPMSDSTAISLCTLLISSLLELLASVFQRIAMSKDYLILSSEELVDRAKMLEELDMLSQKHLLQSLTPLLLYAVDNMTKTCAISDDISRQAARTTLSRIALYMGYNSGPHLLQSNLDYIVDSVCLYVRRIQRFASQALKKDQMNVVCVDNGQSVRVMLKNLQSGHENLNNNNSFDIRMISVVGAVLESILSEDQAYDDISAFARDLVSETLSTIDLLSDMTSNHQRNHLTHRVRPLLSLMHSLVKTAVPPDTGVPLHFLGSEDRSKHGLKQSHREARIGLFSSPYFSPLHQDDCIQEEKVEKPALDIPLNERDLFGCLDATSLVDALSSFCTEWRTYRQDTSLIHRNNDMNELQNQESQHDTDGNNMNVDDDESVPLQPQLELIVKVIDKCLFFLASSDLSAQVDVVSILVSGFCRLSRYKKLCLPTLHKTWPAIMVRIKELRSLYVSYHNYHFSSVSAHDMQCSVQKLFLLPSLLDLVSLLAFLCGDFLNMKFKDDLWPELMLILHICSDEVFFSLKSNVECKEAAVGVRNQTGSPLKSKSLLNKMKRSLLKCLKQLSSMKIRNISDGSMNSSCLQGTNCEDARTAANPVRPIAPLCIWLLLPILFSDSTCASKDMSVARVESEYEETLRSLCCLDLPFALGLFQSLLALTGNLDKGSSEIITDSTSTWESIRAHPVISDSYISFDKCIRSHFSNNCNSSHGRIGLTSYSVLSAHNVQSAFSSGHENALLKFCKMMCNKIK